MATPVSPLCLDSTHCYPGGRKPHCKLANEVKAVAASLGNAENYRRRPRSGKKPECLLRKVLVKNTNKAADSFIQGVLNSESIQSDCRSSQPASSDHSHEQTSSVSESNQADTVNKVEQVFFAIAPCTIL